MHAIERGAGISGVGCHCQLEMTHICSLWSGDAPAFTTRAQVAASRQRLNGAIPQMTGI